MITPGTQYTDKWGFTLTIVKAGPKTITYSNEHETIRECRANIETKIARGIWVPVLSADETAYLDFCGIPAPSPESDPTTNVAK